MVVSFFLTVCGPATSLQDASEPFSPPPLHLLVVTRKHTCSGVRLRYSPLRTRRSGPLPRSVALHTKRKKRWPFRRRRIPALMARSANLIFEECPFANLGR